MANELRHSDVGTALSKSEWEAVGGHIFNSQAAGDIMYASTTSQLTRLGIGTANQVLATNSGATAPEWVTSVASATLAATVTVVDSTDTSSYIAMFDSATGSLAAKTDAGITYNAGTGMLTATGFTGPLTGVASTATALASARTINGVSFDGTGNITVTAAGSTLSDTVPVSKGGTGATSLADKAVLISQDTGTDTVGAVALTTSGQVIIGGSSGPAAATLTAGSNITITNGDGSISIAAAAAGTPTAITVADSSNTTASVAFFESATGDLGPKTDSGLTYNAGTGMLTATGLTGPLTGNAATATALETARTIGGVSFDGTANIAVTLAATATALASARTINGVSFDGTGNITVTAAGSTLSDTVPISKGGTGATSLDNLITLATHTTGDYVQNITAGTGLTSTGATSGENIAHSLSVDASQTQITAVGTIATGVWQGTAVASAYLDADTAHLTTTQTFSGAKSFDEQATFSKGVVVTAADSAADDGISTGTGTGLIATMRAVDGIGIGELVHIDANGDLDEAHADASADMPAIGIALTANTSGSDANIQVLLQGFYRDDSLLSFGTMGAPVYTDHSTEGDFTLTPSTTDGHFIQRVGISVTDDMIYFSPSLDVIERD